MIIKMNVILYAFSPLPSHFSIFHGGHTRYLFFCFKGRGCGNWNMDKLGWTRAGQASPSGKFWIYASIQYTYHNFHKIYPYNS